MMAHRKGPHRHRELFEFRSQVDKTLDDQASARCPFPPPLLQNTLLLDFFLVTSHAQL